MNAHNSLLEKLSNMQDELNSSNNRMLRAIDEIFREAFSDLEDSLDYFNGEYLVIDKRNLVKIIENLENNLKKEKIAHVSKYTERFARVTDDLKQKMCNFFEMKLVKGDNTKRKMSAETKHIVDKLCDFNFMAFEESLKNGIYNFKVDFEISNIHDEYGRDDFNKIIRSFEYSSLIEKIRSRVASIIPEIQEIVRRCADICNDTIEDYRKIKR